MSRSFLIGLGLTFLPIASPSGTAFERADTVLAQFPQERASARQIQASDFLLRTARAAVEAALQEELPYYRSLQPVAVNIDRGSFQSNDQNLWTALRAESHTVDQIMAAAPFAFAGQIHSLQFRHPLAFRAALGWGQRRGNQLGKVCRRFAPLGLTDRAKALLGDDSADIEVCELYLAEKQLGVAIDVLDDSFCRAGEFHAYTDFQFTPRTDEASVATDEELVIIQRSIESLTGQVMKSFHAASQEDGIDQYFLGQWGYFLSSGASPIASLGRSPLEDSSPQGRLEVEVFYLPPKCVQFLHLPAEAETLGPVDLRDRLDTERVWLTDHSRFASLAEGIGFYPQMNITGPSGYNVLPSQLRAEFSGLK